MLVVDTGSYWSGFGQGVILALFQLGGFGMMTSATLLGLLVNRQMRLRSRLLLQAQTRSLGLGDIKSIAWLILMITVVAELSATLVLHEPMVERERRHPSMHTVVGIGRADDHRRGSAGTAGGVKVTTFFVLLLVVWSEIHGREDVEFRKRRHQDFIYAKPETDIQPGDLLIVAGATRMVKRLAGRF